ncbi:diguanylate cyclase [Acidovorax sp. HDW3]|uniref:diguanylate cyclase n=1 Tax=Acidovorax sp. HDW3 TaxID=2714923 RepID=UPI0014099722|nr:diguanylate cyclase [Acidovorax sp. HDW3]QIL43560.1 diguanylate cyclase [Acidovorax sp. HDW3]
MDFDLRTLNAISGLLNIAMGLVLFGMRQSLRQPVGGMGWWAGAPLLCLGSTLLYGLDGRLPAGALVLGANGLLLAGAIFFYFGSLAYYGQRLPWVRQLLLGLATLGALAWFFWVWPDYRLRVAIFTTALASAVLVHAHLLWRRGRGFAVRFTLAVLLVQGLVLLARAVGTFWVDGAVTPRFAATPLQTLYLATFSFSLTLVCIGVLLMASEQLRSRFEQLATRDTLTGVLSRHAIFQECEQAWQRWQQAGEPFSLLLLDLDHFKRINDNWGHPMGDRVLQDFARRCAAQLRGADRLGRYGGEEFLALLPGADASSALASAQRLLQAARLPTSADHPGCSISLGVATVEPQDADMHALLARADCQLYRAKEQGRDQVCAA